MRSAAGHGNQAATGMAPVAPALRKHEQVAERLRGLVRHDLQPGDPLPAVRALMKQMQVSMPTLRAAQALLQQEGLIEVVHGKGAFVSERAHELRIAVVSELDLFHPRTGSYFPTLASVATTYLQDGGADVRLYNGRHAPGGVQQEPCADFWRDAAAGNFDGALIVNRRQTAYWAQQQCQCSIPLVGIGTDAMPDVDHAAIIQRGVQRLVEGQCRRLACLGWGGSAIRVPFREALAATGLEFCDDWIKTDLEPGLPGAGWDEFREVWNTCADRPDGILVTDDILFSDVQTAILELGIAVPSDLQFVVQTNRGSGLHVRLPITALEVDPGENARRLADTLLHAIRGRQPAPLPPLGFTEYEIQPDAEPVRQCAAGRTA